MLLLWLDDLLIPNSVVACLCFPSTPSLPFSFLPQCCYHSSLVYGWRTEPIGILKKLTKVVQMASESNLVKKKLWQYIQLLSLRQGFDCYVSQLWSIWDFSPFLYMLHLFGRSFLPQGLKTPGETGNIKNNMADMPNVG